MNGKHMQYIRKQMQLFIKVTMKIFEGVNKESNILKVHAQRILEHTDDIIIIEAGANERLWAAFM